MAENGDFVGKNFEKKLQKHRKKINFALYREHYLCIIVYWLRTPAADMRRTGQCLTKGELNMFNCTIAALQGARVREAGEHLPVFVPARYAQEKALRS